MRDKIIVFSLLMILFYSCNEEHKTENTVSLDEIDQQSNESDSKNSIDSYELKDTNHQVYSPSQEYQSNSYYNSNIDGTTKLEKELENTNYFTKDKNSYWNENKEELESKFGEREAYYKFEEIYEKKGKEISLKKAEDEYLKKGNNIKADYSFGKTHGIDDEYLASPIRRY